MAAQVVPAMTEDGYTRARLLVEGERSLDDDQPGLPGWMQRLTRAVVRGLPATGAGVAVMGVPGGALLVAASDANSTVIEDQQLILGEGPCVEAFASGVPVLVADLREPEFDRFPMYVRAVGDLGIRAAFSFPLQIGASKLGVLDVYRDEPGHLTTHSLRLALSFAEVAMHAFLDATPDRNTDAGPLPLDSSLDNRREVYQAQGMVKEQLGVSMTEAMSRMRAFAYAHDRQLSDVAVDIVARRITLTDDSQ